MRIFWLFFSAITVFCADFFLKKWAQNTLSLNLFDSIKVFQNFLGIDFTLVHVVNTGAAWGIFSSWKYVLLALRITIIVFLFFSNFFWSKAKEHRWALMLIVVGALGNVVDFFHYGHVVDMFYFRFWGHPFAVFNIADSAIFIGAVLLGIRSLQETSESKKLENTHDTPASPH